MQVFRRLGSRSRLSASQSAKTQDASFYLTWFYATVSVVALAVIDLMLWIMMLILTLEKEDKELTKFKKNNRGWFVLSISSFLYLRG
jgi:hypothetical protein